MRGSGTNVMSKVIAKHVKSGICERCGANAVLHMVVQDYCTQNDSKCESYSLVSHGKDCRYLPVPEHGGRRLICWNCINQP